MKFRHEDIIKNFFFFDSEKISEGKNKLCLRMGKYLLTFKSDLNVGILILIDILRRFSCQE